MKAKHIIAGVALITALVAVGGGLYLWKNRPKPGPPGGGGPMAETVDFATAKGESWQPTGRLVGTVVPKRSINLANEIVGVITEVGFESGAIVEAGQVLIKFDDATERADLAAALATQRLAAAAIEVAEADIRTAKTNVDWANANYDRYKSAPTKSVSESDVDRARTDLEKAQSAVKRQEAALAQSRAEADQAAARADQIKTTLSKKTLKAPFRALAGMRTIHPGQYLAEGTSIVLLNELTDDIYLDFAIPQEYTPLVIPGTNVTATSNILGRGKANTVQIAVLSMDASVNPVTRNVRVRTIVPNKDHALKPGMFVDVEVPIGPTRPVVTLPTTAVRRAAYGDHVFMIDPTPPPPIPGMPPAPPPPPGQMWAKMRLVTLGPSLGDRVIIASGIKEGDSVAAAGSFKLRDGAKVDQAAPKPPGNQPAADQPAHPESKPDEKPASTSSR